MISLFPFLANPRGIQRCSTSVFWSAVVVLMLSGCSGLPNRSSSSTQQAQSITVFIYPAEGRVSDGQTIQVNLTSPVAGQERNHDNNDR